MKPRRSAALSLAVLVACLTCPTVWRATAGDPTDPERIEAVLTGRERHYASTRNGLYRALVTGDDREPGRYRVQIGYDSTDVSRGKPREWSMEMVGPVIEIEVK